jgi:hypothetical protein
LWRKTKTMPKYYITKYALSEGILHKECTVVANPVGYVRTAELWSQFFKIGIDAFENFGDAQKRAVEMRDKRIKSLKKQLGRLENLVESLENLVFVDAGKDNTCRPLS